MGERWGTSFGWSSALLGTPKYLGNAYDVGQGFVPKALATLSANRAAGDYLIESVDPSQTDLLLADIMGSPPVISQISYGSPFHLVVVAAGAVGAGVRKSLELVRDWKNIRRQGAAVADQEEAKADQERAIAEIYSAQAKLAAWAVDKTIQGDMPISVPQLLAITTPRDLKAVETLAEKEPTLEVSEAAA